jgi:hypothetical protein
MKCFAVFSVLFMSGCISMETTVHDFVKIPPVPVCSSSEQCDQMWATAREWIRNNIGFKLTTDSANLLQTGTSPTGGMFDSRISAMVRREYQANGSTKIVALFSCGGQAQCADVSMQRLRDFNTMVACRRAVTP